MINYSKPWLDYILNMASIYSFIYVSFDRSHEPKAKCASVNNQAPFYDLMFSLV